jgi:polar amino acid transport system substrate-binding protein
MMKSLKQQIKHSLRACSAIAFALGWLAAHGTPLQVVTEDSSYSYIENGKVAGAASAIVEATLKLSGLNDYQIALYPWARSYDLALRQPNVLIYPIVRTVERENVFKWAAEFDHINQQFYTLRDRQDVVINNLSEAMKYTVGVVRDDSRQEYLVSKGFTRLVISPNNLDNLRKLLNGQVAIIPMPEREARQQCKELGIAFDSLKSVYQVDELTRSLYIAFSASTPDDTVARFSKAFRTLKANGTVAKLLEH